MDNRIDWEAVQAFLSTMDVNEPKHIHLLNATRDSWLYGWNAVTTMAMLAAIHETYDAINIMSEV